MIRYSIDEIESIECIGEFEDEYVYDIEMDDTTDHTFFANDILIHNSVYITIDPILQLSNIPLLNDKGEIYKRSLRDS